MDKPKDKPTELKKKLNFIAVVLVSRDFSFIKLALTTLSALLNKSDFTDG